MKKRTYKIEKSTNKRDCAEVYSFDERKGFYRFINYIPIEQIDTFIKAHVKDDVLLKFPTDEAAT